MNALYSPKFFLNTHDAEKLDGDAGFEIDQPPAQYDARVKHRVTHFRAPEVRIISMPVCAACCECHPLKKSLAIHSSAPMMSVKQIGSSLHS
jgi:hypothetical protein